MRVSRWYCAKAHKTFSLLPDCMSARLQGTLDEAERVVALSEAIGVEKAAANLRVDACELPGALRWLRRRRLGVHAALLALVTALPGQLGPRPRVGAMRVVLDTKRALVALREIGADHLQTLSVPLGFGRRPGGRSQRGYGLQHETGTDKPSP